ncbi:hypothetical protein PV11_05639 [Exophiala sideris]|uniref:aldehyde dehydrogenase (NAD(+)) n=1 Tax=Exophiala sideris TaxID=1016849 RepID=A0A0D1ZA35_9EURO|nr:hypothetical protein PV11_05639 [Exophiala sideris]
MAEKHTNGSSPEVETRLFIDGQFVNSIRGKTFPLFNPATGGKVVDVYEADADDVDRAVQCAKQAFPSWSETEASERQRLMLKLADLVDAHAGQFAHLEALAMGKPVGNYPDQILGTATLRYYAGKAFDLHGLTSLTSKNHLNLTFKQPYGVCGAIIPWNVPLIMLAFKVGPALTAGNTLVLKSSEKAPLTSLLFAKLAQEAGYPPGVLNVLSGFGLPCGDAIARHPEIRKIAFTGSAATGKKIQRAAAESNLKSCTLELGGKSPLLIFEDADLEKAANAAAFSIVFNSGQICMASSRVYVHQSVADKFIELYKAAMVGVMGKKGNPLDPTTTYGPQADKAQYENIRNHLRKAEQDGIKFLLGGPPNGKEEDGLFIPPALAFNPPEESDLMKQEVFGSISCVATFTDEEDVVKRANDTVYGLYASVFTRDINRAIRIAKAFEAGTVAVNETSPYYCQDLPIGGYKGSGIGRELGDEGLHAWTETKTIYMNLT